MFLGVGGAYNLHDPRLAHVSRIGSVNCRSCTTSHNDGRRRTRSSTAAVDDLLVHTYILGHDLPVVWKIHPI